MVKSRLNRKSLKKNKRTKKSKIKHGGSDGYTWRKWEIITADKALREQEKLCLHLGLHLNCNKHDIEQALLEQQEVYYEAVEDVFHSASGCMDSGYPLDWLKEEECLVAEGKRGVYAKGDPLPHLEKFYFENILTHGRPGHLPSLRWEDVETVKDMNDYEVTKWLEGIDEDFKARHPGTSSPGLVIDNDSEILNDMDHERYPFADKIQLLMLLNDVATIKEQENQY